MIHQKLNDQNNWPRKKLNEKINHGLDVVWCDLYPRF